MSQSAEQEILRLLHALNRMMCQLKDEAVDTVHELTILQAQVLRMIKMSGPLMMSDIVKALNITPASATGIITRLEEGGWLFRERDADDRRIVRLVLQPEAKEKLDRAMRQKAKCFAKMLEPLTDAEKDQLISLLAKLETNQPAHGNNA